MQAAGLAALGAAPLAAGALLPAGGRVDVLPPCPLLALTGVPCPLCGGTRAFAHAGHGDLAALLDANAVWVAYAVGALLVAGLLLVRRAPRLPALQPVAVLALLAAPAWAWALTHRGTLEA